MKNYKKENHRHWMVGLPTSIPSSGDVLPLLRETPIPTCSHLTEADISGTKLQKIKETTKLLRKKLADYIINPSKYIDFSGTPNEIFGETCKLFCMKGKESKYAKYERTDESLIEFRLGLHDANGINFNADTINISVYISYTYRSFRGISTTPYDEFEIKPKIFESYPKRVVDNLVNAVLSAIDNNEFKLDNDIATQIDTTQKDTIEDIVNRYCEETYLFKFGKRTLALKIDSVLLCTLVELKLNMKDEKGDICMLQINKSNKTFLIDDGQNKELTPSKKHQQRWKEFIHCLFKYAYNNLEENIVINKESNKLFEIKSTRNITMRNNKLVARRTVRNSKQTIVEGIISKIRPIIIKALNERELYQRNNIKVNNIKDAVEAFNAIDEDNEDEILDKIAYAIEEYSTHNEPIELSDTKGYEEIGYDYFEPSDTFLSVYKDLYYAMLERGIHSLDFIAFAHLRYTENDEGRKFYKNVNQIIY